MLFTICRLLSTRIMQDKRLHASCHSLYMAMNLHAKTTAKQYAATFDIPEGTIRRCLALLKRHGWVEAFYAPEQRQQIRDGLKALACLRQQVTLIEIADVELSYDTLIAKLKGHLALLPVHTDRPLARTIANLAADYSHWAREQRTRTHPRGL